MKDPDSPTDAARTHTVEETGEYWSRKLQGTAFTPECCWRAVPEVDRQRIRRETGGSEYGHWAEYCVGEFLAGRTPVDRMLSVGCGTGGLERILARLGAFKECDAWDVAAGAIEAARQLAREEGFGHIHYEVRDITTVELEPDQYDAVWFENALHHIEPLEKVCETLARAIKPDGYLFLNEYIGPPRFDFPPRQRELIRAAFAMIPARFRLHREAGTTLTAASIPTAAEVEADDSTESVRSADIPGVVESWFDVVAFHKSGGSLLQFLLNGIAGNFRDDDPESLRVVDMLLRLEEDLLEIGELESDFAVIVARPRRPVVARPSSARAQKMQREPAVLVTLEEELAQKRASVAEVEGYARSLEQEIARRDAQIREVGGYANSLEEEIQRKQNHLNELEGYARSLEGEVARRKEELAPLRNQGKQLQNELEQARDQLGQLRNEREQLRNEQGQLRNQREQARHQMEQLGEQLEQTRERLGKVEIEAYWRRRPRIHAVIVHHRGKELLEHCLRRLLASHSVDLQVIVVSNACKEPLPEIADRSAAVHLVRSEASLGFSAANNLGVDWASRQLGEPEHWFFLNNDAGVEPDTLGRLAEALGSTPRAGVAGPQLVIWGAEDHLNSLGLNVTAIGEAWDEGIGVPLADYGEIPGRREVLAVTGSAILVTAETYREIGGWNELYGYYFEDIDLCLQARRRGWKVIHVPDAVAAHAVSATADQITDFKRLLSWRNQLVLILRHWPAGTLLVAAPRLIGGQLKVFVQRLRLKCYADARLQARAWGGALRLLPRALAQRLQGGGDRSWTRFLRPAGSVPVIRLPPILPGRRPWEQPAAPPPPPPSAGAGPERSPS